MEYESNHFNPVLILFNHGLKFDFDLYNYHNPRTKIQYATRMTSEMKNNGKPNTLPKNSNNIPITNNEKLPVANIPSIEVPATVLYSEIDKYLDTLNLDRDTRNSIKKTTYNKRLVKKYNYDLDITEYTVDGKLHREDGPAHTDQAGTQTWYVNGVVHRDDGPAVIDPFGSEMWFHYGEPHRLDGPAFIYYNGTKMWYQNGKLHNLNGPAVIYYDTSKKWYQNGKLHREDGPAVEDVNGSKYWYQNGKLHNLNGPAIIMDNKTTKWYVDGKLHNLNGPAITYHDGRTEYYMHGEFVRN